MRSFIIGYGSTNGYHAETTTFAKGSTGPGCGAFRNQIINRSNAKRRARAGDWTSTRPWLPRSRFAAPSTKEPTATSAIEKLFAKRVAR